MSMYIEKVFVYLVLLMLLALTMRLWWNERRLSRMEALMKLVGQHGMDVDRTVRDLINVIESFFSGFREIIEKNRERENERRKEANRESEGK